MFRFYEPSLILTLDILSPPWWPHSAWLLFQTLSVLPILIVFRAIDLIKAFSHLVLTNILSAYL